MSEADSLYQLDWYKSSLLNCFCLAKGEATLSTLLLVHSSPSPSRDLRAGISPLLRLSTLCPLIPVLTTLSVFTATTVGIIGENLTWVLGPEPNEIPSIEDTKSSITGSPSKLTDGSKSPLNSKASIDIKADASLSLSYATSRQASTSGENP
ncbi:hypothetical protein AYI68_g6330 [Smittium mucronatum]|uniref:Uncharacterized protein n=1 Tax=Smittium mucronatum TaxID=133383 RepID=A0A1R0GRX7_9FUNG|nr:hypothetical protein AYI68_g6330 [Smittium mucronatum]